MPLSQLYCTPYLLIHRCVTCLEQPLTIKIYSGDAGVEGFNSLLSTLQFEVKESSTWINAFAARCFMFFRQSEKVQYC
jgi:hypothetical protein